MTTFAGNRPDASARFCRDEARWHSLEHGVELLEASFQSHVYERHIHDTYAVGVTLQGVQSFWCRGAVRNGTAGDVIAINPGEAHDGKSGTANGYAYRMIYVPVPWLRTIVDDVLESRSTEILVSAPILRDGVLATQLCAAWSAMAARDSTLAAEAQLYDALLRLVERHAGISPASSRTIDEPMMRRVRDFLHSRVEDRIGLQELADFAGMSRFQLTRQFQRTFGLPLHAFHLHLKLEEGKRRLRLGTSIARVASDLGFADQSHFHRRFKGMFGVTPRSWQRSVGARPSRS